MVEVALIVSLLGIGLAVSVPTFLQAVRTSKISEATKELQRLHRHAASYYETPQPTAEGNRLRCLPAAAGPTPPQPSVDPVMISFQGPQSAGSQTWRALDYEPERAVRYRYSFLPRETECGPHETDPLGPPLLLLRAEGDLDGDGYMSLFERGADDDNGVLAPRPMLTVQDRVE